MERLVLFFKYRSDFGKEVPGASELIERSKFNEAASILKCRTDEMHDEGDNKKIS